MKFLVTLIISTVIASSANAGFMDSEWFEPSIGCAVGAAGGYAGSSAGNESEAAAIGCVVTAGVLYLMGSHYKNKYTRKQEEKIQDLEDSMKQLQMLQADQAVNGKYRINAIPKYEYVPPKKLKNGDIISPHYRMKLEVPGAEQGLGR